jgi:hypothetical protein
MKFNVSSNLLFVHFILFSRSSHTRLRTSGVSPIRCFKWHVTSMSHSIPLALRSHTGRSSGIKSGDWGGQSHRPGKYSFRLSLTLSGQKNEVLSGYQPGQVQPLDPTDSPRELHFTQSPGKQQILHSPDKLDHYVLP